MKTCKTCRYFDPSETESELFGNPRGYCRRYPKAVLKSEGRWCGEWKEQTNTYNSYDRGYADATNDARDEYAVDMDIERGVAYDRGFAEGKDEGYKAGSSVLFASRDEGYDQGYTEGERDGWDTGHDKGYSEGHTDGKKEGFDKGYEEGYSTGGRYLEAMLKSTKNSYDLGFAEGKDEGYKAGSSVLFASEYNKL